MGDGYGFPVFFVTVNGQKKISNEAREYLYHQAVLASGKKMIDIEVPFPPGKEFLDVPAELINKRHLLCGQIETVGGNPVSFVVNCIANESNRLLSLIDT